MTAANHEIAISVEMESTEEEIERIRQAFSDAGYSVAIRADVGRRALDPLPWVLIIWGSLPIQAFIAGIAKRAGEDTYDAAKRAIKEFYESRNVSGKPQGLLEYKDPESGFMVYLHDNLPEEAFRQLNWIDWDQFDEGPILYDPDHQRWVSALDEMD